MKQWTICIMHTVIGIVQGVSNWKVPKECVQSFTWEPPLRKSGYAPGQCIQTVLLQN